MLAVFRGCVCAGMDGIDRLLQIVAYYRRRQPQSPEVSHQTITCESPSVGMRHSFYPTVRDFIWCGCLVLVFRQTTDGVWHLQPLQMRIWLSVVVGSRSIGKHIFRDVWVVVQNTDTFYVLVFCV